MKIFLKIAFILISTLALLFFSEDLFILSIRWIPGINVSIAFWVPLVLSIIVAFVAFLLLKNEVKTKVQIVLSVVLYTGICLASFYSNPFYPEDFENRVNSVEISPEITEVYLSDTEAKTTCYLLVTCPFCEIATIKLNALYQANKINDIELVYFALPSTADSLVATNGISIPYRTIENDSIFFLRAGSNFPSIQFRDSKELLYWSGNNVNFACFDYLISRKTD